MKKIDYAEGDEIGGVYTHTASFTSGFNTAVDFYNKAFEMGYTYNGEKWIYGERLSTALPQYYTNDQMFDLIRNEMKI